MAIAKPKTEDTNDLDVDNETATESSSKDVTAKQASEVSTVTLGGNLSAEEMKDLDFGFGAFPIISLDKGEFIDSEGTDYGDEFNFKIMSYKAKYFYKVGPQDEAQFFYTYDKIETVGGEMVSDVVADWKDEGLGTPSIKKYMEVVVQMVGGEHEGSLRILSIPPTSVTRLSGYIAGELNAVRGKHYSKVVTKASAGERITKDKYNWRPWAFSYVEDVA